MTNIKPSSSLLPALASLPHELPIKPIGHPVDLELDVPGSKSITNRALVQAALADGPVMLTHALVADDTVYMVRALKDLGFQVEQDLKNLTVSVQGQGGRIPVDKASVFTGNAGTVMRFLSAAVCLGHGSYRLDGTERMRERPIADLTDALTAHGVQASCERNNGCPPVLIEARGLPGGRIKVDGSRSSQYLSGLLLAAPYALSPLELEVTGEFVSKPYVELTLRTMADFGVGAQTEGERLYRPFHGAKYRAGQYAIEGDASNATYFLAAAAILGGRVAVTNLRADSPQGDAGFAMVLERMGCRVRKGFLSGGKGIEVSRDPATPLKAVRVDLNHMPDVAQTLAAVAMFAQGTTEIINVGNLRIKETDRLKALATELARLGAEVEEGPDSIEITPSKNLDAAVDTYDDHRMAMALTLVGLGRSGVTIKDPACVGKTYPTYFQDVEKLRK